MHPYQFSIAQLIQFYRSRKFGFNKHLHKNCEFILPCSATFHTIAFFLFDFLTLECLFYFFSIFQNLHPWTIRISPSNAWLEGRKGGSFQCSEEQNHFLNFEYTSCKKSHLDEACLLYYCEYDAWGRVFFTLWVWCVWIYQEWGRHGNMYMKFSFNLHDFGIYWSIDNWVLNLFADFCWHLRLFLLGNWQIKLFELYTTTCMNYAPLLMAIALNVRFNVDYSCILFFMFVNFNMICDHNYLSILLVFLHYMYHHLLAESRICKTSGVV